MQRLRQPPVWLFLLFIIIISRLLYMRYNQLHERHHHCPSKRYLAPTSNKAKKNYPQKLHKKIHYIVLIN